ncbi:MAG: thrombospondin type 3 repeat-containing protein [Myxococcota bacterium]
MLIADELPTTFYFGSQLGFRVHWTRWFDLPGDGWIDAHHTFGRSGGVNRHGIDWATGYEFQFTRLLGLGPYLRFQYVPDPGQNDPVLLMAGITANLMPLARTQSTLPDEDLDGVPDERDVCPEIPFGEYMDTSNEGCPARDRDRDGLLDPVDACPSESMWPYPGDEPDGCPLPDADGDGVPDEFDACPETFAPDGGDALREGCAVDPGF